MTISPVIMIALVQFEADIIIGFSELDSSTV